MQGDKPIELQEIKKMIKSIGWELVSRQYPNPCKINPREIENKWDFEVQPKQDDDKRLGFIVTISSDDISVTIAEEHKKGNLTKILKFIEEHLVKVEN